jgi:hypothetical protein
MPRGIPSKSTVKPPTIRERALEPDAQIDTQDNTVTVEITPETEVKQLVDPPSPLVTIRLRRVGPIITDSQHTVSIPAPAFVKEGERVLVAIYSTVGDWEPVAPRLP